MISICSQVLFFLSPPMPITTSSTSDSKEQEHKTPRQMLFSSITIGRWSPSAFLHSIAYPIAISSYVCLAPLTNAYRLIVPHLNLLCTLYTLSNTLSDIPTIFNSMWETKTYLDNSSKFDWLFLGGFLTTPSASFREIPSHMPICNETRLTMMGR